MLVGNKCDMDTRVITTEQGKELSEKYSVPFFETSAKSGLNIKEVFEEIAREIIKNKPAQSTRKTTKLTTADPKPKDGKDGGCGC